MTSIIRHNRNSLFCILGLILMACGGGDATPTDSANTPDSGTMVPDLANVDDTATPPPNDVSTQADGEGQVACVEPGSLGELDACCDFGPASCVPMDIIPDDLQSQVAECGEAGACVPDEIIDILRDGGTYAPATCASLNGAEGRCLSVCLPDVGAVIQIIPQDICQAHERCVPCVDPITGEDSGVCEGEGLTCG